MAAERPFGAFAPGKLTRAALRTAWGMGSGPIEKRARSVLFRAVGGYASAPFDVEPFPGVRARLHPSDNIAEKRAFIAPHLWDAPERAFLDARMAATDGVFRFLDVGANAGLYTLAMLSTARRLGGSLRALALEPQPEMLRRLRFNLAASEAGDAVEALGWAAVATRGPVSFAASETNRGEARVAADGALTVEGRPLLDAAERLGGVDAMKIDIEGAEAQTLAPFFDTAPRTLWPRAVVIEAKPGEDEGHALCLRAGYQEVGRTRLNALLRLPG